jgi:hypothetical protein
VYIYPYRAGSKSVKALAKAVPAKIIRLNKSRYRGSKAKVVVNWGATQIDNPQVMASTIINPPDRVRAASNKLSFFQALDGSDIPTPPWSHLQDDAEKWIREGYMAVCRTVLAGHSGEGIVIAAEPKELVHAPLYTRYVKKKDEYRVHVYNNPLQKGMHKAIDFQRKALRNDRDKNIMPDWRVRNHKNGFIYAREGIRDDIGARLEDLAIKTMIKINLDFGAVDVIWNELNDQLYVLEVNTAPGLEGTTLARYANAMKG